MVGSVFPINWIQYKQIQVSLLRNQMVIQLFGKSLSEFKLLSSKPKLASVSEFKILLTDSNGSSFIMLGVCRAIIS